MAEMVHKFGRNAASSTSWSDVWMRGGVYNWPTVASQLRISSASTADNSTGTGARSVTLTGLDANFVPITETVALTGTSTAVTSQSFVRMNRAYVASAGSYNTLTVGGNAGKITINTGSSGAMAEIGFDSSLGRGQTQVARYTSPAGLYMYINSAVVSIDSKKTAGFAFLTRHDADATSAPFGVRRLQIELDGLAAPFEWNPDTPLGPYPPKTDVWWAVKAAAAATAVSVDFEIILSPTTFQRS